MINPFELVDAWVEALRQVPQLVQAVNGEPTRIYAYHDQYPEVSRLAVGVQQMVHPSIMVVWIGTDQAGELGEIEKWRHRFQVYLKAEEGLPADPPRDYYAMWHGFVNGVHQVSGLRLFLTEIHTGCYPMQQTVCRRIPQPDQFHDYFQIDVALMEKGDD